MRIPTTEERQSSEYEERKVIGRRLADLRRQRNLTQLEVAEKTGMRDAAVSAIELGRNTITVRLMVQLAFGMGMGLEEFVGIVYPELAPFLRK